MTKSLEVNCVILFRDLVLDFTVEQIDKWFGKEIHERRSDLIDKYITEDDFDKTEYMPFGINGTLRREIKRNEKGQITTICMHGALDRPVYEMTDVYDWFCRIEEMGMAKTGSLTMIMDGYFVTTATFN